MARVILIRFAQSVAVLLIVSLFIFMLPRLVGNPVDALLPIGATKEEAEALTKLWGFDRPLFEQYFTFLANAVTGDLGQSRILRSPALDVVMSRLPVTITLAGFALLIAVPLGVGLGVVSALRRERFTDRAIRVFALLNQALPSFWIGMILILIVGVRLHWLPTSGAATPAHYILPAIALATFPFSALTRITRSSMLTVLGSGYVEFARAKGLPERSVVIRHALRNALISPVTFLGFTLGTLLAGSILIESVFNLPGIGRLAVDSVRSSDYAVIQVLVLLAACFYIASNFLVDLTYALLDPRIRVAR